MAFSGTVLCVAATPRLLVKGVLRWSRHPGMENYYLWSFPGCPVKVRLSVSVIAELQQRLEKCKDAVREEGLLLGGLSEGVTQIEDCLPVPDNGFRDRPDALARL